ncbi:MAG: hypothetical protein ACXVXG_18230 [Nocardioidaceae bacterium]
MLQLPPSARLVAWGNAALRGAAGPDDVTDAVARGGLTPRVAGLPGEPEPVGLALALGRLRAAGVTGLRLALPVPGDPAGLPGPAAVNERAVEAGAAVLTVGAASLALLPAGRAAWQAYDVRPAPVSVPSVADAEQVLRHELRESTEELVRLDLARWHPEVTTLFGELNGHPVDPVLPAAYPARAHRLLHLAQRVGTIVSLAEETVGAAVTSGEIALRSAVLTRLHTAVRRGLEAACNAASD